MNIDKNITAVSLVSFFNDFFDNDIDFDDDDQFYPISFDDSNVNTLLEKLKMNGFLVIDTNQALK